MAILPKPSNTPRGRMMDGIANEGTIPKFPIEPIPNRIAAPLPIVP